MTKKTKEKVSKWIPVYFIITPHKCDHLKGEINFVIINDIEHYASAEEAEIAMQQLIEKEDKYTADNVEIFKLYKKEDQLADAPVESKSNL